MKPDPDRFDRQLEQKLDRREEQEQRAPVITSKRGPRFVGQTPCPHCFYPNGITYHGLLRSGQHVYELAVHSMGAGMKKNGQAECVGSRVRLEKLADGTFRKAP